MAVDPSVREFLDLGFTPAWFASGIVSSEFVADFVRIASATTPGKPARFWRWAAFRDYVEEYGLTTPMACWAAYRLGESERDGNLGAAIMCCALYQATCPAELVREAASSDRPAVRRVAAHRAPTRS